MVDSRRWRVSKEESEMGLLAFLRKHCKEAPSVKALKRAIDGKHCAVNRRTVAISSHSLLEGDVVTLDEEAFEVTPIKEPSILYEDDSFLIVNKPPGMVCDPDDLKSYFPKRKGRLILVHRLDKETSGVLILAKNNQIKEAMIELFKKHLVRKVYLAMVDGVMEKDEGKIDNFLGKKHAIQGQTVYGSVPRDKGQRAVTHWKCVKRGKKASLVSCEPLTGRTHQLRVHMSAMHHPILGDLQYGTSFRSPLRPKRHLLHAYSVVFTHPKKAKEIEVLAPIPSDFQEALESSVQMLS